MPQEQASKSAEAGVAGFVRKYWLIGFALQPLVRFFLLAASIGIVAGPFRAERSFWLTCWFLECAVILAAAASGFSLAGFFRKLNRGAAALAAIWIGAIVISTALAEYPGPALRGALQWIMHGYFAVSAWYLISRDPAGAARSLERFARLGPWVIAATGLLAAACVFRIGLASELNFALHLPGFAHLRHTGYIFAPAIALSLYGLASRKGGGWEPAALLALNTGLCLWFGSRGPFLGLIAGLAVAILLFVEFRRPAFLLQAGASLAAGAVLSLVVPSPAKGGFSALGRLFGSGDDADGVSSGRVAIWKETWSLLFDRPLFGHGSEQFQQVSTLASNFYRHPHDFVLQVLFDWGFVGGGAFLGMLAFALAAALRGLGEGTVECRRLGIFGAATMLGFALVDGILFYPYTIALTVIFLCFAIAPRDTAAKPA